MISNKKQLKTLIKLLTISLGFFLISGFLFKSALNDPTALSKEILSPAESLYEYGISNREPFKYRVLFSSLVELTYSFFSEPQNNQKFYWIYIFWSGFFYVTAVLSFYILLNFLGFNNRYSILGTALFLMSPAIIFAFSLPVHTREDMMAYTILNIGLICLIRNKKIGVLLCSILGVLCRETLLILPLIFLLYRNKNIAFRWGTLFISLLAFFSIRIVLGSEGYDIIGMGLKYNLDNIEGTIGFFFLVFSFMWPVFFYDIYCTITKAGKKLSDNPISLLRKSSLLVFTLVFITTIIGGRINEIRLLFIIFPWVIPTFLYYLKYHLNAHIKVIMTKEYKLYAALAGGACLLLYLIVYYNIGLIEGGVHDVPYVQWATITCIYLYVFFLSIPLYISMIKHTHFSGKMLSN